MKQIDISELDKEIGRINKQLGFISDEIKKLEVTLQDSAFLDYEYKANPFGLIKWGETQYGEGLVKRICVFHKDRYKPLIECPADIRWVVYHHLQNFVDNLIKHQKSKVTNENSQDRTEKS